LSHKPAVSEVPTATDRQPTATDRQPTATDKVPKLRSGLLIWCLLPLLLLGGLALWVRSSAYAGSLVQVRLELDTTLLVLGALISVIATALWYVILRHNNLALSGIADAQRTARAEHQRFAERLDHELKNPLTTMRLNIENLRSLNLNGEALTSLDSLDAQASRLIGLTTDLRKLSALEHTQLSREPVNLQQLLEELMAQCNESPQFRERRLSLTLPAAPWPIRTISADPDLLQLALYNLLENAAKYSNPNDVIELRASDTADNVNIVVADTGSGIRSADQQKVFDELFRGQNVHGRAGSGIGLTLVRGIIEKHAGSVALDSQEGQGTQFTVTLPL